MKCVVVFTDSCSHPISFLLKKGFRHVFVCIDDGQYWVLIERLFSQTEINVIERSEYDIAAFYRNEGFTVVETEYGSEKSFPFEASNCVGLTKTIAGVRSFSVTPWQLYKRLT